jgi:CheY-like chemotaxis protein
MPLVALVVDDSMLIRHTVCRFLEERGFTVEPATNGSDAIESIKRIHPDVIITDLQMPKMDGTQLITALRSQPATKDIPIVVITGKRNWFEKKAKCADCAIFKDIDIEDQLAKALQAVLGDEVGKGRAAGK